MKCKCNIEPSLRQIPYPANLAERTLYVLPDSWQEAMDNLFVAHLVGSHDWHLEGYIGDPPPLRSGVMFDPELRTGTRRVERAKTDSHEYSVGDKFRAIHSGSVLTIRGVQTRHETGKDKGKKLPNPIYILHHENQASSDFPMNESTIKANLKLAWQNITH